MVKTEVSSFIAFLIACAFLSGCNQPQNGSDLKIVGGKIADSQPFMAGITDEIDPSSSFCGGSFITDKIVLTASHCVSDQTSKLKIAGGISLNSDHGRIRLANVAAVRMHPQYSPDTMDNDLALIFLSSVPVGNTPILPITLNRNAEIPAINKPVTVIGWGNTSSFGALFENELRQVDLPTISTSKCRQAYSNVTDRQICAGDFTRGGIDSCQGDSGGPLITDNGSGQKTLVGIVSWGEGCALSGKPGVYTKVSAFAPWIDAEVAKFTRTTNTPVTAELIHDYYTSYCYIPFRTDSRQIQGDATLVVKDLFEADSLFQEFEPGDSLPNGDVENVCSFETPGSKKYTANLVAYPATRNQRAVRRIEVSEDATQKKWLAETESSRTADLECRFDDDETSKLSYEDVNGGILEYADKLFYLTDEVSGSGMGNAKFSCVGPNMTYSYYEKQNGEASTQFYLKVDTTLFDQSGPETRRFFKMERYTAGSGLTVSVATDSGSTGKISVKNSSSKDLHTWELQCDKAFDLVDSAGRMSNPTLAGGFYRHKFARPDSTIGTINAGATVSFEFSAATPLAPSAPNALQCRVNRVGVPVSFKAL